MNTFQTHQNFIFVAHNEKQALKVFDSSIDGIKNVIILTQNIGKTANLFTSGVFEGKIMTKMAPIINSSYSDLNSVFKSKFSDMKGYTYKVAALSYAPFLMKNIGNIFSGFEIFQLDALAFLLNFQYTIVEPPDGQWGKPDQNGTWTGLIGHAMYGHTNFSMGMITISEDREAVIDFCVPFYIPWVS